MILPLAFVVALLIGLGHSEEVRISVELRRRDDGEVGASLYVANATRDLFQNSTLSVSIDAFMDHSKNLIGAAGFVKETNRNETIELTCDASSKDEEIKKCQLSNYKEIKKIHLSKDAEISVRDEEIRRLRLSLCPIEGEELLRIVSADDKGFEETYVREKRTQTADFLIIDGHTYTDSSVGMTNIDADVKQKCNFFVLDDGTVYEGIGWNVYNYYYNGGLGSKSLIIGFIKKDRDSSPSDAALKTLKKLVRTAICSNVLSPHYSVIPYHLIFDFFTLSGESFERNGMTEWVGYKNNLDFVIPSDEKGAQPIVSKLEWSGTARRDELITSSPIKYLVVQTFFERCFFNCGNYLKNMLDISCPLFDINFYLTEDGSAYEDQGWERTSNNLFQGQEFAVVVFTGTFNTYVPNKRIFDAFEGLIEEGLRLGKLSPTFKILLIGTVYENSINMGKYLEEKIRKHPRFSETL